MTYLRRLKFFALLLCVPFLSSHSGGGNKEVDSTTLLLRSHQKSDDLENWIYLQKDRCNPLVQTEQYKEAIAFVDKIEKQLWRKPEGKDELKAWGSTLVKRAYSKDRTGDFIGAKKDYLEVLTIYKEIDEISAGVIIHVYYPLANIYTRLGANEQAIPLLETYIQVNKENEDIPNIGQGYSDLGTAYRNKGEFAKALEIYLEGMEAARTSDRALGFLRSNAAVVCLNLEDFQKGIEYGLMSLAYFNQTEEYEYIAGANLVVGKLYSAIGRFDDADSYFERAQNALQTIYPDGNHRNWGKLHEARGDAKARQNQYVEALGNYQRALVSVLPNFVSSSVQKTPDLKQLYSEVVISDVLIKKAQTFAKLAEANPRKSEQHLKIALRHYACYFQMEGVHRREYIADASKLLFVQEVHKYGEEAIEVALKLYEQTNESKWLDECIVFTERTKGIILSEANDVRVMNQRDGYFPKRVSEFVALKSKMSFIESQIRKRRNDDKSEELTVLKAQETKISKDLFLLDEEIRKQFPELHSKLFQSNQLTRENISNYRKAESATILTYYFGRRHIYCFGMNKKSIQHSKIEITEELLNSFQKLHDQLTNPNSSKCEDYSEIASKFYTILFKPFEAAFSGEEVVIIPDGELTQLPFEALCDRKGTNFSELNYLVKRFSIRYAYSLKWLNRDFSNKKYANNFLGVAPEFKHSQRHASLPFSIDEIQPGKELGGELITGSKATKSQFLKKAKSFRILHLSTHAQMWDEEFEQASIAFYQKSDKQDNYLLASELLSKKIAPELMVLSACETGKGDYIRGEGMLSLSRIFAQSGTKNIVASLWKVNHESNSEILSHFYEKLRDDETTISTALTFSKREYLDKNKYENIGSHPFYWSGMVHVGTNELNLESTNSLWSYAWFLLLLVPAFYLYFKVRKNRRVA